MRFIHKLNVFLLLAGLSIGQLQAATVSFIPQSTTVNVGDTVNVDIFASDFTQLAGGLIDFQFDSAIIDIMAVPVVDNMWNYRPDPGSRDNSNPDIWNGLSFDALFGSPALEGSGLIATLSFEAVGIGAANLDFLYTEFFSRTDELWPVLESAEITVTAVPAPAAVLLFMSGLLALVRFRKTPR